MNRLPNDRPFRENDLLLHADGILFEEQEHGDAYVLNKKTGRIVRLNQIASLVFKLCGGLHFVTAQKAFLREYGSQNATEKVTILENNFTATVRLLIQDGLVQLSGENSQAGKISYDQLEVNIANAYIELTSICNAHCHYCYNHSGAHGRHMDSSLLNRLLDELIALKIQSITFSGGEPSLHPEFLQVIDRSVRQNIETNVITNGWFADNEKYIKALMNCNVQFSLDHVCAEKHDAVKGSGNYAAVEQAIRSLAQRGHSGSRILRVNLVKENIDALEDFIQLGQRWGVTEVDFRFLHRLGRNDSYDGHIDFNETPSLAETIIKKLENLSSSLPEGSPAITYSGCLPAFSCNFLSVSENKIMCMTRITPEGEVFPCQYFSAPYFSLGQFGQSSLTEIVNSNRFRDLVELIHHRRVNNASCNVCVWQKLCWKGCPAKVYTHYSTIWKDSGECRFWKKLYRLRMQHSAEQAKKAEK